MEYDHSSTDKEKFSLHDCRATSARLINDKLIFFFSNGIYFKDYSQDWPNTGKAEVEFSLDPMRDLSIYLFTSHQGKTIREECALTQLIEKVDYREWELEFAYRYDGFEEILYKCWIWQDHEPWALECELWIGTKEDIVFRWNPPDPV